MSSGISVVIPVYNRSTTIGYCLQSVLAQTLQPLEVLVVDDGSLDDTVAVVERLRHPLVRVVRQNNNAGAQEARRRGIMEAKGDWIAFQDSDDEWLPEKLEVQWKETQRMGVEVSYSNGFVQQGTQRWLYDMPDFSENTYRCLLTRNGPMFQGMLVRRLCFSVSGLPDPQVPSFQEWDTALLLARHFPFGYVSQPLFVYHLHEGETISKNLSREAEGVAYIVTKHKREILREVGEQIFRNHCLGVASRFFRGGNNRERLRWLKETVRYQTSFLRRMGEGVLLALNPALFIIYIEQNGSFRKWFRRIAVKIKMRMFTKNPK